MKRFLRKSVRYNFREILKNYNARIKAERKKLSAIIFHLLSISKVKILTLRNR